MKTKKVIAIACADIHLSSVAPACRAGEPDWFSAMARPLTEIRRLAKTYSCPVLCAGDVFHHWKSSPELINFAIDMMPGMYAVPGQHDMPYHSMGEMVKSAYETLERAQILSSVTTDGLDTTDSLGFGLYGFPWGSSVTPPAEDVRLSVCLHHAYRWMGDARHAQADEKTHASKDEYAGFDVALIGDNHISWEWTTQHAAFDKTRSFAAFNCGSLMRRSSDQLNHRPRVGLVCSDGSVDSHYLNCSADVFDPTTSLSPADEKMLASLRAGCLEIAAFANLQKQIEKLDDPEVDQMGFYDALRMVLENKSLRAGARKVITEAIEHGRQDQRPS